MLEKIKEFIDHCSVLEEYHKERVYYYQRLLATKTYNSLSIEDLLYYIEYHKSTAKYYRKKISVYLL